MRIGASTTLALLLAWFVLGGLFRDEVMRQFQQVRRMPKACPVGGSRSRRWCRPCCA